MAGDEGESSTDEGPTQNCVWCFDKRLREGKDMSQSGQQISMIYSSFNTTSTLCSTRNRIHYTPKKLDSIAGTKLHYLVTEAHRYK